MKKITCLFIGLLVSLTSLHTQEGTPKAVLNAFSKLKPEVSQPFWEFREGAFVAMFAHKEGLKKIFFDQEGKWLETRTRLQAPALPKDVKQYVERLYTTRLITYIGKVEQPTRTSYRIETESASTVSINILSKEGILLEEDTIELSLVPQ